MNNKTKSTLALLGTLFIGMVLGALITGVFVRSKMKQFHNLETRMKHHKRMFHHISEADSEQKAKIDEIFDKNFAKIDKIEEEFKAERKEATDMIAKEVETILNEDQKKKMWEGLEDFYKRRHRKKRK